MNTFLSPELIDRCLAPQHEIDQAQAFGKKRSYRGEDGTLTAYLWEGKVYITEMEITPEAFDDGKERRQNDPQIYS